MSLLPREHGAYGQLVFPLVTSFAVAGVTTPALLLGLAAVAGFLAHEPLLVLLGRRGPRARHNEWLRAGVWLTICGATTVGAGGAALWSMPAGARWSLLLPLLPTAFLAVALSAQREKSPPGEVAVALALSLVAVPACLAAGASTRIALSVAVVFALVFVTGTLSVRVVVLKVRGGGNPFAVRATRLIVFILAAGAAVGLVAAGSRTLLPWTALIAATPGLLAAVALAARAPSPARLRAVGWTLVSTTAAAALILIVGLAGRP
jgi:hypothetical protein